MIEILSLYLLAAIEPRNQKYQPGATTAGTDAAFPMGVE